MKRRFPFFASVRYGDCGHEYFLAFSFNRRYFCPSCHQKRVVEFGDWLCWELAWVSPHRHILISNAYMEYSQMPHEEASVDPELCINCGMRLKVCLSVAMQPDAENVCYRKGLIMQTRKLQMKAKWDKMPRRRAI